jgi:hypothetical protein
MSRNSEAASIVIERRNASGQFMHLTALTGETLKDCLDKIRWNESLGKFLNEKQSFKPGQAR